MSAIVIPAELVQPMREGFRRTAGDGRRWFDAEAGTTAVGLDVSTVPDAAAVVLDLSADQSARFWLWWRDDLGRGLNAFAMPDPLRDGWPWLDNDGTPVLCGDGTPALVSATWLCQFGQGARPTETVAGVRRRIAIEIMVWPV